MERSRIVPHLTWSGPQPDREENAYLLAMLLRIHSAGLDSADGNKRDAHMHPSVLTTENLHVISVMYAFYTEQMAEASITNTEDMLKLVKASHEGCVENWIGDNAQAIHKAEAQLLEYVDTTQCSGFRCFG